LPRGVAAAADLDTYVVGGDEAGGVRLFGAAVAEGEIARGIGGDREGRRYREIERVGQAVEDIPASADAGPANVA
jgi:hypothetical protein